MTGYQSIHPYELIPLNIAGYILGAALLLGHLAAFVKRDQIKAFLVKTPRNHFLAQITLAISFIWFILLIIPDRFGTLSSLSIELAEFERIRWILLIACPVFMVLLVTQVKELLFPRALGFLGLMTAAPFLAAAFLKDPATRVLIPIWGYAVIFLSLIWVGKPYVYRDMVNWITAKATRWNVLCILGMAYGVLVLVCDILWW